MPHRPTILLVDNDPLDSHCVCSFLQDAGYNVTVEKDAQTALVSMQKLAYDLIVLDLVIPGMDGMELVSAINQQSPQTPVIILTANATLESAIESLRLGVKDYLLKPISLEENIERIKKVLADSILEKQQREIIYNLKELVEKWDDVDATLNTNPNEIEPITQTGRSKTIEWGSIFIDLYTRHVTVKGEPVHLSPISFDYLVTLIRHAPKPVSHETLLLESQGFVETRIRAKEIVRWRIYKLRKSIEPDSKNPCFIITVPGAGYSLAY